MIVFAASICIAMINPSFVHYHGLHMYLLNSNPSLSAAINHFMPSWIISDLSNWRTVLDDQSTDIRLDRGSSIQLLHR